MKIILTYTGGFIIFYLHLLPYVISAAMVGGFVGANLSRVFSERVVKMLFITALSGVILLNIYNGAMILFGA